MCEAWYFGVWKVGIRIYHLKASDFHRPIFDFWSEKTQSTSWRSRSDSERMSLYVWSMDVCVWQRGLELFRKRAARKRRAIRRTIRGPGVEPRRAVKFWKCKTGQKTWLRWGWDDNRERLVPHIAFEMPQSNLQAAGAQCRWNKGAALKLKDCGRLFLWATGNFTNAKESLESDEICNREKSRLVWWQGYFSRKDETVKGRQC